MMWTSRKSLCRYHPLVFRRWLVLAAIVVMVAQPVFAQRVTIPLPAGKSGFTIYAERAFGGCRAGMESIRVTIERNPYLPAKEDDRFTIRLKELHGIDQTTTTTVLEAGQTETTAELFFPQGTRDYSYRQLRIDSQRHGHLAELYASVGSNSGGQSDLLLMPTTLFINDAYTAPASEHWAIALGNRADYGNFGTSVGSFRNGKPAVSPSLHIALEFFEQTVQEHPSYSDLASALSGQANLMACRPEDLPSTWIGMSGVDHVFVTLADLQSISGDDEQRNVLRRWVAAGGTLVVLPDGKKAKRYGHLNHVFPLLIGEDDAATPDQPFDRWMQPTKELLKLDRAIADVKLVDGDWERQQLAETDTFLEWDDLKGAEKKLRSVSIKNLQQLKSRFLIQRLAAGHVVVFDSTTDDWTVDEWRPFYNALQVAGPTLQEHIGSGNNRYYREGFWIEGVGDPPVRSFQVLITLFMIVAGPVMLLLLRRTQRMQLLFVTVPALSLAACGGLLAYAIASDGFVTLGRARTFTRIDARTGDAMTHARAAYYSGLQPAASQLGYDCVAVQNTRLNNRAGVKIAQFPDGYRYSGGRIRARSPHQLVTLRSYVTRCGIGRPTVAAERKQASGDSISFENRLQTDASLVLIRNKDGCFVAQAVAAGDQANAVKVELPTAAKQANDALAQNSSFVDSYMNRLHRNGWQSWAYYDQQKPANLGDDDRAAQLIRARKLDSLMPVGSWLAICDEFPLASEQLNDVQFRQQVHMVMGDWLP